MHFFNPPALMKLVEVVATARLRRGRSRSDHRGRPPHGTHADPRQGQPRLHRQPPRPPVQPRVAADARRGGRRRGDDRPRRPPRRRLPHGPVRADRPDRPRRQPQRRPLLLRAGRRARALAPEPDPGTDGRRRPARPQGRRAASTPTATARTATPDPDLGIEAPTLDPRRAGARSTPPPRRSCPGSSPRSPTRPPSRSKRRSARPADMDTAMRLGFNWPRGPLELTELIGAERAREPARRAARGARRRLPPRRPRCSAAA